MKYLDDLPHEMFHQTGYMDIASLVKEAKNHAGVWLETTTWETMPSGKRQKFPELEVEGLQIGNRDGYLCVRWEEDMSDEEFEATIAVVESKYDDEIFACDLISNLTSKLRAEFALQEQIGGRGEPFVQYWILDEDETWGDVVRRDGHSYRPGGPETMYPQEGESLKNFTARVRKAADGWQEDAI